jgi:PTH1 family peptidyl-tRNA hydrolase
MGLGNPGEEYTKTRHNIGFQCVNELARRHSLDFSAKIAKSRVATGTLAGQRVALAKPFTYMNLIGQSVVGLCQWYKVAPAAELLVIYDDLDLPFGALRLRERGSAGTHNGMKSVIGQLGSQVFPRSRVGVGQGPPGRDAAQYVLGRFTREEQEQLPAVHARVADAVEAILREGFTAAMNRFNRTTDDRRPPDDRRPTTDDRGDV